MMSRGANSTPDTHSKFLQMASERHMGLCLSMMLLCMMWLVSMGRMAHAEEATSLPNSCLLMDFNDQRWNSACNAATQFANTGTVGGSTMTLAVSSAVAGGEQDFSGTSFAWNQTGGTALSMDMSAHPDVCLIGAQVTWGQRFLLEARVRRTTGSFSGLSLVRDMPSGTRLHWYINSSQRMVLEVNKGDATGKLIVTGANAVFPDAQWVNLAVMVDLTATTLGDAVKFFRNGALLTPVTTGTFTGTMTTGSGQVPPCELMMLDRLSAFDLMCDFIRITPDASAEMLVSPEWYAGEVYDELEPGASAAILVYPQLAFRKVGNRPSDFDFVAGALRPGMTARYLQANAVQAFHGVYEINFAIDVTAFAGSMTVDVLLRRPEDETFKKIAEVPYVPDEMGGALWMKTLYWNSRRSGYEWTAAEAQPYTADGAVRVRFRVH